MVEQCDHISRGPWLFFQAFCTQSGWVKPSTSGWSQNKTILFFANKCMFELNVLSWMFFFFCKWFYMMNLQSTTGDYSRPHLSNPFSRRDASTFRLSLSVRLYNWNMLDQKNCSCIFCFYRLLQKTKLQTWWSLFHWFLAYVEMLQPSGDYLSLHGSQNWQELWEM